MYLITAVKKPSIGSFKKSIKESNASIKVVSTVYEEAERLKKYLIPLSSFSNLSIFFFSTRKGFTVEQLADQWYENYFDSL